MREFTTSAKAASDDADDKVFPFMLDGVEYNPRMASENRLVVLSTQMSARKASNAQKLAAIMGLCEAVFPPDEWATLQERLADDDDPFGLDGLSDIIEGLLEDFAGVGPTGSPNGSSPPPPTAGSSSTAGRKRAASTPSRSPSMRTSRSSGTGS